MYRKSQQQPNRNTATQQQPTSNPPATHQQPNSNPTATQQQPNSNPTATQQQPPQSNMGNKGSSGGSGGSSGQCHGGPARNSYCHTEGGKEAAGNGSTVAAGYCSLNSATRDCYARGWAETASADRGTKALMSVMAPAAGDRSGVMTSCAAGGNGGGNGGRTIQIGGGHLTVVLTHVQTEFTPDTLRAWAARQDRRNLGWMFAQAYRDSPKLSNKNYAVVCVLDSAAEGFAPWDKTQLKNTTVLVHKYCDEHHDYFELMMMHGGTDHSIVTV
jgi:hypothetical protein